MVEPTIRDQIWTFALMKTLKQDKAVFPDDIARQLDVSEKTVKNCLLVMSKNGFLRREALADGRVRYTPFEA